MNKNNSKPKGFIAIVSLLIIATISMFFAMRILMDGVNNASLSANSLNYENTRINATTCIEDALIRIKKQSQFNTNFNYTISEGNTCSATLTWFNEIPVSLGVVSRLVNLDVTGVNGNFTRTFRYEMKVTRYDVNHLDGTLEYMNTITFNSITEITS